MPKPIPGVNPPYFQNYINQVPDEEIIPALKKQTPLAASFLKTISEEKAIYSYAAGKWTIKELLQHIIDTERILSYRALCIARKEKANLPGFEENDYAINSLANNHTWDSLINEFLAVRNATELLFESFDETVFLYEGTANNNTLTVSTLGYIIVGHFYHHKNILEKLYLKYY